MRKQIPETHSFKPDVGSAHKWLSHFAINTSLHVQVSWHLQAGEPFPNGIYLSIIAYVLLGTFTCPNTLLYLFQPGVFISFFALCFPAQLLLICFFLPHVLWITGPDESSDSRKLPRMCINLSSIAAAIRPGHMETQLTSDLKWLAFSSSGGWGWDISSRV